MREQNLPCLDIRMREVGMKQIHQAVTPDQVELVRRDYVANGGWETFLSYEDPLQDILIGLLRLRKVSSAAWLKEVSEVPSSIIRELHVGGYFPSSSFMPSLPCSLSLFLYDSLCKGLWNSSSGVRQGPDPFPTSR